MSKVRNLPETSTVAQNDIMYIVDVSEGPNAGRKVTINNIKSAIFSNASEIPFDNTGSDLTATDVQNAILETNSKVLDHSDRHAPDNADGLPVDSPVNVDVSANSPGVANAYSRADHKHNVSTAPAVTIDGDTTNFEGTANTLARSDHTHNIPTGIASSLNADTVNSSGTASTLARSDHTHNIATALVGDITAIQPNNTAAAGTSSSYARGDHRHPITVGTPVNTGVANLEGVSTSFSRSDHTHNTVINNLTASSSTNDTTTSLTDVLITGMSITPPAGTYLALWSGSIVNSANGAERTFVSLYSGGTQVSATERSLGTSGGAFSEVSTFGIITVNGSQAIEVRWRVVGGTSTVRSRNLTLIRLG